MLYPDGMPGWVDLLTPDPEAVKRFYTDVFDWSYRQREAPDGGTSVLCRKGDKIVAGIHRMPAQFAVSRIPPVWTASLIVADLTAVLARAEAAGGSVVIPVTESGAEGMLASVADPTGGAIGLWQPGTHPGAELTKAPGTLTWLDLLSHDVAAALPFYTDVFGWRWEEMGEGRTPVAFLDSIKGLNKAVASAQPVPEEAPTGAPSYWLPFFATDDPQDSALRAREAGGDVFLEPQRRPGVGTYAGLTDPAEGRFMVMRFETPSVSTIVKIVGSRLFGSKKK